MSTTQSEAQGSVESPSAFTLYRPLLKELWPDVGPTALWFITAAVLTVGLALSHSPLVPLPGVVTILIIPGAAVMSNLRTRPVHTDGRVVLAVSLSILAIMVVGGVASELGPHLGVAHPLNATPETVIWIVLALAVLATSAVRHRDPVAWVFDGVQGSQILHVLAGGLLVVLSILGVAELNFSGDNHLAVFSAILDVAVLLAGVVGGWSRTSRWPLSTLLYCASLALLVSTSLRGGNLYGWDVQQEFAVASNTIRAGVWVVPANHDPYASMLSLTVLPAVLHSLVKLRLLAFFQLVVPAILALLPLAVFSTVRSVPRWITIGRRVPRPGLALAVVVGLIVSSTAFSSELTAITRQAMALTMMTALVMVIFDRTMLVLPSRIIIGLLLVGIAFTHYTTSYLLAVIFAFSWVISFLWSRGWLGTPKASIDRHRYDVRSRRIINIALVLVALVAAFGWNLGVTRNYALSAPSSAVTSKGAGFVASTNNSAISPQQLEQLLVNEDRVSARWIVPFADSASVKLKPITSPASPGVASSLGGGWNEVTFLVEESLWAVLGFALLYGLLRLGRRRSYEYSGDLVGLAVAGLMIGALLRFSGTLATYYSPERAAIFTAILLSAPLTLFLDDLVTFIYEKKSVTHQWVPRLSLSVGFIFVTILIVGATGLGALFFGGQPPGSLTARDVNPQLFTVSTTEVATATWLQRNVPAPNIVQSDLYGQLVLLSEPGAYDLVDEIMPREVDQGAYIYLSTANLKDDTSQAEVAGNYYTVYRTTTKFFNRNLHVVYSTGLTRVYH